MIIELTGLNKRLDLNVEIPKEEEEAKPIVPEEAFTITGNCKYRFAYGGWDWFIENFGDKIITKDILDGSYMFQDTTLEIIPFEINLSNSCNGMSGMFQSTTNLKKLPVIKATGQKYRGSISSFFGSNKHLSEPITLEWFKKWFDFDDAHITNNTNYSFSGMFYNCPSLRTIEEDLLKELWMNKGSYSNQFGQSFGQMNSLDEIKGIYPPPIEVTSNMFNSAFRYCYRVKEITFATDNGIPYVRKWSKQAINLRYGIGHASHPNDILDYQEYSGILDGKGMNGEEGYQKNKNDKDSWTWKQDYSRYNKKSALNTIKSLPDVSSGSNNTISFLGNAGSLTDEGAINTLTQEEIAIASAKGWTVAFG